LKIKRRFEFQSVAYSKIKGVYMVYQSIKAFFLSFLFPVLLFAQAQNTPDQQVQPGGASTTGWWAVWWVWIIVFFIIVAIVWAWAASSSGGSGGGTVSRGGGTTTGTNTRPTA